MELYVKHFSELTVKELYGILELRSAVFVLEQNCAYQDIDGLDENAYHMWFSDDDGIAAYLRILPPGVRFDEPALGRIISARRRSGIGSQIVQKGITFVQEHYGPCKITIEAQQYAREFYEKNGFVQISEPFDEDGIPHILMRWE